MLGTRGARLGILHPEIFEMQVVAREADAADRRTIEMQVFRYNPETDQEPYFQSFHVPFTHDTSVLQGLPGLELDAAVVDEVLGADDPVAAGISAAVAEARALLSIDGVDGVNLSGLGSGSGTRVGAEIKAEVGRLVRAGVAA